MKFPPLQEALVEFDEQGTPTAPAYGDVYHSRSGALPQARAVFLKGCGLPTRWQGRERFTVLETGFGLGNNFLATWQAWRDDPQRCGRLYFVSIDKHPVPLQARRQAMAVHDDDGALAPLAQQLLRAWPSATPDIHLLAFEQGRVMLMLAYTDVRVALRELRLQADAIFLDGFAPRANPGMWEESVLKAVGRLAAPGAVAATWCATSTVRQGLMTAGFKVESLAGFAGKREMTVARFEPRQGVRRRAVAVHCSGGASPDVLIIGAGLAGAACAQSLARIGINCRVLDAAAEPAQGASGNPAGLFHGVVHREDGAHARFNRAAALMAERVYRPLIESGAVRGRIEGLLRTETRLSLEAMQAVLQGLNLPADHVQVLPGSGHQAPLWFYPGGGWLDPRALVRHWMGSAGVQCQGLARVARLQREGGVWHAFNAQGQLLARAPQVLLCHACVSMPGGSGVDDEAWPVVLERGQITQIPGDTPGLRAPAKPMAGGGYALTLVQPADPAAAPARQPDVLCGASSQRDDPDFSLRARDHLENLRKLDSLTGSALARQADPALLTGRVGWRLSARDRLPIVGPMPAGLKTAGSSITELPTIPGLYLATALASRGITWAPLIGAVAAAWITGDPQPLPRSLLDAIDPRRFLLRDLRESPMCARPAQCPTGTGWPDAGQTHPH